MRAFKASGNTFKNKDALKSIGFFWNKIAGFWVIECVNGDDHRIQLAEKLPGVVIIEIK